MSVWLCIPSARDAGGTIPKWREAGYKIAVQRDPGKEIEADICLTTPWEGYAKAVNELCRLVREMDMNAQWMVAGGDDTLCDQTHSPEQIAVDCTEHFNGTFGVMQPTGDRWAEGSIDRICGSPWMGREFCRRMNGGAGPFWPEYRHFFLDEEMQHVTIKLGVLWQRRDIIHRHDHFCRVGEIVDWTYGTRAMPAFLKEANSPEHWNQYQALFEARRRAAFPGHEPCA